MRTGTGHGDGGVGDRDEVCDERRSVGTGRATGVRSRRALLRAGAALAALPLAGVAGCGALTSTAPRFDFYVIEDLRPAPPAVSASTPPRVDRTLLLTYGATQALFDSDRIVFTRDGASRAYYQYSNWSERPGRRIVSLAEARLAQGGGFRAVAQTVAGARGDQVLSLRLEELMHDDSVSPGVLRLGLTAELLDWHTRTIAARRTFSRTASVGSRDAKGAARAANVAVTELLDELATWTETSVAAVPRQASRP
ncbi:MAG: ABC-type transport auxiliary lipoprotein family protein [Burkholderiales bacterium]|jgi:ABC-type uncharacterized transport system auxiliary subunit